MIGLGLLKLVLEFVILVNLGLNASRQQHINRDRANDQTSQRPKHKCHSVHTSEPTETTRCSLSAIARANSQHTRTKSDAQLVYRDVVSGQIAQVTQVEGIKPRFKLIIAKG